MIVAALVLFAVYLMVGFVVHTVIQLRRTGDTGFRGISGRFGQPRMVGWGLVRCGARRWGPWSRHCAHRSRLVAADWSQPLAALTWLPLQATGTVLAVIGIAATFATQTEMGPNWRIGVDDAERTDLVTSGPFRLVRNPIFTAMAVTGLGLALMVPNAIALTGFVLLLIALQLQVRVVEEPYLRRTHDDEYAWYEATAGRFLPGLGTVNANHAKDHATHAAAAES